MQGGCAVRLYHKDLEAYLVAEGLFGEVPTEESMLPFSTNFLYKEDFEQNLLSHRKFQNKIDPFSVLGPFNVFIL